MEVRISNGRRLLPCTNLYILLHVGGIQVTRSAVKKRRVHFAYDQAAVLDS